ncbi:MAG TPA: 3-phosphoshikimate 1-carboxyvinyltransferase, partial [Candidatus Binatia bacterium]|nr:3-phosphoshikimate 1-carboxyvinyltransferase [Candidatus Binatia bacterium]
MTAILDGPARVSAPARLRGRISLPSDKSIGHRSLIANALADGEAEVVLRHPGADLMSTVACLRRLGARIEEEVTAPGEHRFVVRGGGWTSPTEALDCGNSATTLRLLAGAIAGRGLSAVLDGDGSLRRRPMERVAAPLRAMGAAVTTRD